MVSLPLSLSRQCFLFSLTPVFSLRPSSLALLPQDAIDSDNSSGQNTTQTPLPHTRTHTHAEDKRRQSAGFKRFPTPPVSPGRERRSEGSERSAGPLVFEEGQSQAPVWGTGSAPMGFEKPFASASQDAVKLTLASFHGPSVQEIICYTF